MRRPARGFGTGVKSTAVSAKNQIGSYARAGMLGLQLSLPPLRAGSSSGTVPATPSALVASQNEQPASQAAAPPETKLQAPAASTAAPNVEAEMGSRRRSAPPRATPSGAI